MTSQCRICGKSHDGLVSSCDACGCSDLMRIPGGYGQTEAAFAAGQAKYRSPMIPAFEGPVEPLPSCLTTSYLDNGFRHSFTTSEDDKDLMLGLEILLECVQ